MSIETESVNIVNYKEIKCPQFVSKYINEAIDNAYGHPILLSAIAEIYYKGLGVEIDVEKNILASGRARISLYYVFKT
uniref:Transcriptional regulator n=1 Tax=Rhabditophanes sp. KR3021 TaxID=114890 RepID=A0AC35TFY8_9BILA